MITVLSMRLPRAVSRTLDILLVLAFCCALSATLRAQSESGGAALEGVVAR